MRYSNHRPPGPTWLRLLGSLRDLRRNPLEFLSGIARDYGDIATVKMALRREAVLLSHPDHIRYVLVENNKNFVKSSDYKQLKLILGDGLLTAEGEQHRRQRRLVQPAFHRKRIATYGEVMTDYTVTQCEEWRDGAALDMNGEMTRLTLRIVAKVLFDSDVKKDTAQVGEAITSLMPLFDNPILVLAPRLFRLLPGYQKYLKQSELLDSIVYGMIAEHRKSNADSGDLMSMLLAATDEEDDNRRMTDKQARDEVMTLFLAGHETTANALSWAWYLVATHPEVEERLHSEVDNVLGGQAAAAEDLRRLDYTRKVITEAMRLYPPAWAIARRALGDFQVGDYAIPAGTDVVLSPYIVQHDPRFFPEPNAFDPERWTPEAEASRPEFSYFPFGGGPRLCIGEAFAKMEMILVIAAIAQRWKTRVAAGQRVDPMPLVTLRMRNGLPVTLERRKPAVVRFAAEQVPASATS